MGLDRGKGTAFVLKSDITYKQWNMGSNATALDSKGKNKLIIGGVLTVFSHKFDHTKYSKSKNMNK